MVMSKSGSLSAASCGPVTAKTLNGSRGDGQWSVIDLPATSRSARDNNAHCFVITFCMPLRGKLVLSRYDPSQDFFKQGESSVV
jgi:hypothetical protein